MYIENYNENGNDKISIYESLNIKNMNHRESIIYAQELVETYFHMMMIGCCPKVKDTFCSKNNILCRSHPQSKYYTPSEAFLYSIQLATQSPVPTCIPIQRYYDTTIKPLNLVLKRSVSRQKLSNAMELDLVFNTNTIDHKENDEQRIEIEYKPTQHTNAMYALRHESIMKRKLMIALKDNESMYERFQSNQSAEENSP